MSLWALNGFPEVKCKIMLQHKPLSHIQTLLVNYHKEIMCEQDLFKNSVKFVLDTFHQVVRFSLSIPSDVH